MINIIIVSGWAAPKEYLDGLRDDLAGISRIRMVAIHELPFLVNSGGSGRKASGFPVSDYALGLGSIINEAGPSLLMGWSTGGMIALEAAAHLPDNIKGLFLISTAARFSSSQDHQHGTSPSAVRAMVRGIGRDPERTLTDFFEKVHKPFNEDNSTIKAEVNASLSIGIEELSAGLNYLQKVDLRNLLRRIDLPVNVVHGKEDAIIPWQAGEFLSENIRKSSLRLFDGVGHDLPVRAAGSIVEEIERTLKTIG